MTEKKPKYLHVTVPEEQHFQFAILCRQKRQTMKDRLLYLVSRDIEQHKKEQGEK
jgi:hypothetical protein